jgi:serine/threonine protein kinase
MTLSYPCSFENAAEKPLKDMLPVLHPGSLRKVRTISEAINGKIKLVESFLPDQPKSFVVKQVSASAKSHGPESFSNEIHASLSISQKLCIPNVAEVYFAAKDDKFFYLASEHCENGDLLTVTKQAGRFEDESMMREVLCQILFAVKALHESGIVHRDLSLENVLVASDGGLRLTDWAQAIMVRAPGSSNCEAHVTQEAGPPGKPHYRAPELLSGAPYSATKTDTFAIGVMLYALVVGSYPFVPKRGGSADNVSDTDLFPPQKAALGRCCLGPQLQKAHVKLSPGCLDMMEQLLAPNPALRLSAAEALMHPWLTGSIATAWPTAIAHEDSMEEVSTQFTNDNEGTDSESVTFGDSND